MGPSIEMGSPLFALDYACDASTFAVAGKDKHVYVFDERTKKQVCKPMFSNGLKVDCHQRSIRCLKYLPNEPNVLLSGGWDGLIKIFDIRVAKPVGEIQSQGIFTNNAAIDVEGDHVLAGSYCADKCLAVYSISMRRKMYDVDFCGTAGSRTKEYD
jgi:WD40 repeat protein